VLPKKTHWSSDIVPELHGKEVVVAGWVWELRDLGRVKFIVLRDREGFVQITLKAGRTPERLLATFSELGKEDAIAVRGVVEASKIARRGVEISPVEIWVLNKARPLPIDIWSETPDLATRLRWRSVDLKRPSNLALFTAASKILREIREVLYGEGFVEVFTPKIIATSTEGGADLFPLMYFERVAYLSQSPQLYKEQLTASLERVFEVGPAFRAERHNTNYHLNEFTSVDAEAAFMDYWDMIQLLERILGRIARLLSREEPRLREVGLAPRLTELGSVPRVDYDEAVDALQRAGYSVRRGDDLTVEMQKALTKYYGPAYFIVHFPALLRPFYTKRKDGERTESYDLVINGIEVASGSTRIHKRDELEEEMKVRGLDPRLFESHLSIFDLGMPPHAGFGLGFNRLLMALLGLENVRQATLYPRDRYRLEP
jgi:aspartyl-tRNA synthetase